MCPIFLPSSTYFGWWISYTSFLAWDFTLVDLCLLQFCLRQIMPLTSMLFSLSGIVTVDETVSTSDFLGSSLDLCGTIINILNFSPRSPLTKALFLVIIEVWIICRNSYKKMVLHATPSPRARETVTCYPFTTEDVLQVITAVMSTPNFTCSIYFPLSTPLVLNGSTSSISFKHENFSTKLGWKSATDCW